MTTPHILIIEDEERIAHWLQRYFELADFQTCVATDGQTGLKLAREKQPTLIVLDLMLPKLDGMTLCRTLRRESDVPIIMLTARDAYQDRIAGLNVGADDYVIKPFDPEEVVARAKAVLRRVKGKAQTIIQHGGIELNMQTRLVKVDEKTVTLSRAQFEILAALMRHPNQVLSRSQLIKVAFDDEFDAFDRAIDTHIRRLRNQIEANPKQPQYIHTVYGVGYKLVINH